MSLIIADTLALNRADPHSYRRNVSQLTFAGCPANKVCKSSSRNVFYSCNERQYHSWNRLRFDPLRSRSRSLVAVALTGSVLLCGQAAAGRPWPGLHRLHCDSRKSYNSWIDSVPVIGSRRSVNTNVNSSDSGIEGHDETHDNATSNPAPPPQNPVEGREKNAKPGSSQAWVDFSSLGDRLSDLLMPEWAKILPGFITKLQNELSTAPGSLAEQIWWEAHDPEINPEIIWDASVRVSDDLCKEEESFLENRKRFTRRGLAKYIGLKEEDIHPDDIPTIAMCGSGGGLRALVAGTSSYLSAYESGLFDCVTYTAGVSGSCWLQALYYSSISKQSHAKLIQHLKNRLGVHIAFPPAALELLSSAPTDKYLLSGLIEKWKGVPNADFGIVDLYGLLLAARLMVPKGDLAVDEVDLKISNQRRFTDSGAQPLPIYTAVRHEIPIEGAGGEDLARAVKREAWFQWFEYVTRQALLTCSLLTFLDLRHMNFGAKNLRLASLLGQLDDSSMVARLYGEKMALRCQNCGSQSCSAYGAALSVLPCHTITKRSNR